MDNYEINAETLLIMPFGRGKSKVYEFDGEYIVNKIPLDIIKDSCLFFGCSYEGRREAVKDILGIDMKVPIIIEDTKNIIFFPTNNCVNNSSIWVSYQNLLKYIKVSNDSTMLYFKNKKGVTINIKYNLIDNQIVRCIKLESLVNKRKKFIEKEQLIVDL